MGGKAYEEKIWVSETLCRDFFPAATNPLPLSQDHASGSLLISESGGICTDMHGKPLDFSQGRTLKKNDGVVAAGRDMHAQVLEAVKQAVAEAQTGKL
jgi:3'-phosphoadenosine 5'-phosphosulfate (PAPS) 3'-phosphatase